MDKEAKLQKRPVGALVTICQLIEKNQSKRC